MWSWKGFVVPEWFALLLIKQKNHKKRFGEFEFEYFGGSDVVNKLYVQKYKIEKNVRITRISQSGWEIKWGML